MEKQAIWRIPVIFEFFPKTPTRATAGSVTSSLGWSLCCRPGLPPALARPGLFADSKAPAPWLRHPNRGVLLESPVRAQLAPPQTRPPQPHTPYCVLTMTTATEGLLSAKHHVQAECSTRFAWIHLFSQ